MPTNNVSKLLERVLCGIFDREHQEGSQIIQWGKLGDTWCAKKPFEYPRVGVYKKQIGRGENGLAKFSRQGAEPEGYPVLVLVHHVYVKG